MTPAINLGGLLSKNVLYSTVQNCKRNTFKESKNRTLEKFGISKGKCVVELVRHVLRKMMKNDVFLSLSTMSSDASMSFSIWATQVQLVKYVIYIQNVKIIGILKYLQLSRTL